MSAVRIFVPRDATACALGADAVVASILQGAAGRGIEVEMVRNALPAPIRALWPE